MKKYAVALLVALLLLAPLVGMVAASSDSGGGSSSDSSGSSSSSDSSGSSSSSDSSGSSSSKDTQSSTDKSGTGSPAETSSPDMTSDRSGVSGSETPHPGETSGPSDKSTPDSSNPSSPDMTSPGTQDQSQTSTSTADQVSSQDTAKLASEVATKEQELAQARSQMSASDQAVEVNHDNVALAAYTFQAAGTVVPSHNADLDQISAELQSSLATETQAEDQISQRSGIVRFFLGGDKTAANQVEQVANTYDDTITKLQTIANSPDVSPGTRTILQTQIDKLTAEHERLHTLASSEKADTGLFGGFLG